MSIILLDADGPLFNLTGASVEAVNDTFGATYTPSEWTQWDAHFMTRHHHGFLKDTLWHNPDFWALLPATDGAVEGVRRILAAGHEIHVVTSAFESCHGWEAARRTALHGRFGIDKKFVTITSQKHLVYGDVFIDDKPEHVAAWAQKWKREHPCLFDMPHNSTAEGDWQRVDWDILVRRFG